MKKLFIFGVIILIVNHSYSQGSLQYQTGITAEENLNAIGNLSNNYAGAVGFDTRYEGIKGSPRLFDTLLHSSLKVEGIDDYIRLDTDIDLIKNILIYTNSKTSRLVSIPSDMVSEIIISAYGNDMKFRTIEENIFKKNSKEIIFYQVLKEGPFQFIKIPGKDFIKADYKGAYSADRRYDEYRINDRYYIMNEDSTYLQTNLSKKSLTKLFPDKKAVINNIFGENKYKNNEEEMVISLLEKF